MFESLFDLIPCSQRLLGLLFVKILQLDLLLLGQLLQLLLPEVWIHICSLLLLLQLLLLSLLLLLQISHLTLLLA